MYISYSLYLWHQPVFAFFRHVEVEPAGAPVWGGLILLCVGLAYLSWLQAMEDDRIAVKRLPELREKLFKVL